MVLSLDGGGVRGLSSLYILREIMKRVKELDDNAQPNDRIEPNVGVPFPCDYFDFIVGTSTGGLIAVMLGRLRMSIDDCIKQYWLLSNKIFRPPRTRVPFQVYSRRTLQEATQNVVQNFCRCHGAVGESCMGEEYLRQYDYGEATDGLDLDRTNKTCRVAVVTVREGGRTTSRGQQANVKVLFRSYNHRRREYRPDFIELEPNPKDLESSTLMIDEACSATTAAPTYFRTVEIRGRKYMDGGLLANNPAVEAWNEAKQMAVAPGQPMTVLANLLVSVGTGRKKEFSGSNYLSLARVGLRKITDTDGPHQRMLDLVGQDGWRYHRFSVPWRIHSSTHKGLAKIKLDQCKKKKKQQSGNKQQDLQQQNGFEQNAQQQNGLQQNAQQQNAIVNQAEVEDRPLRAAACNAEPRRRDGYKPDKYDYITFDKLRDRSMSYCNSAQDRPKINECASLLREFHF
ncbi:hypothetical protein A1O7_08458 [Cladophialophora yegresii CBS 114405]|uniref:PNPLA domain-containing protein n=1 Tax=Cladophialophora yegresii CBS 114405 TaxID=1182544 RepID=W9VR87_9EURO|nr:uncharacterized protein A1O7_08458 [Cladophialophora yegresii CBS 114405]EXJ55530.1 hypothetical protein A1O7_08458 [Cladophialophora yegresii CBS 114405]